MRNQRGRFWWWLQHIGGAIIEWCMALSFNISHFIVHKRKARKMGPKLFQEFEKYWNKKRGLK